MEVINTGMRKSIKLMAITAQTMQFISLMPKPQDFVVRVVGDVVYLSSQINRLSDELNKMLDAYADIPGNYLMTQMNSITGSLTGITNRLSTYTQNAVNQTIGFGENTMQIITDLTGTVIDTTGAVTKAVVGMSSAVAETGTNIVGQFETASDIHDGAEIILEWTENGFKNISETATSSLNKVTQSLTNTRTGITNKISESANAVNDSIEKSYEFVESLITKLKDGMKKLSDSINSGFKEYTGMNAIGDGSGNIADNLKETNNSLAAQVTSAVESSVSTVIKNFSIGKVVASFAGILTQSAIVKLGLDELPPINFESMLCQIRDDMTMTPEELEKQYNELNKELDDIQGEFKKFSDESVKEPTEERNYTSKNYKEFLKTYDSDLKAQRETIRKQMKYFKDNTNEKGEVIIDGKNVSREAEEFQKRELRSAIKEAKKLRKQVKNAKQASKFKDIIGEELQNLKKEVEYRSNSIKSDWMSMLKQYKDAISEIKGFFSNGGSCDMFIDDCCDAINKDFNDIKELCKNLTVQLAGTTIKICMPSDIGTVVPNPAFKIADFWMDLKTVIKFIKDLITLVLDIINNINKIARIMLNGINNLKDIIKQFFDILGLKWLMNLIQSVIDLFSENITSAKEKLENTLSPIHFNETVEYENTMEAIEDYMENSKLSDTQLKYLSDAQETLRLAGKGKDKDLNKLISNIGNFSAGQINNEDDLSDFLEDMENQGDAVVAYKSPIIADVESSSKVSDLLNGSPMDIDIKFIGWKFFHPNLNHTKNDYYSDSIIDKVIKKIKSNLIKKASKTGNKKNGGVTRLRKKNVGKASTKIDIAYDAFYWYKCYTEDLEKDCFNLNAGQGATVIDSFVQTQNGSIVKLSDGRKVFVADNYVRGGDYVTVDGVKYRVKK